MKKNLSIENTKAIIDVKIKTAGRPLTDEPKADKQILLYVTAEEKAEIQMAAKAAKRSMSDFAKSILLSSI